MDKKGFMLNVNVNLACISGFSENCMSKKKSNLKATMAKMTGISNQIFFFKCRSVVEEKFKVRVNRL